MLYVQRDASNRVIGRFANPQQGYAEEFLPDAHPDLDPPFEDVRAQFVAAVQAHLDATARTRNYDGILSACSYATSTHLPFSTEGQAAVDWRDAVWLYCYAELAKVEAGTRTIPASPEAFIAELPSVIW